MKQLLRQISNGYILIPFLGIVLFFNLYLFPSSAIKHQGEALQPLDLRMAYTKEEVTDLFTKMGTEGRASTYFTTGVIDSIYPVVYTIFFILLLVFCIKKTGLTDSRWYYFLLLPAGIMIADYIENLNTLSMLRSFPLVTDSAAKFGSAASALKWYLSMITIGLLLLALLYWILQFFLKPGTEK